MPLQSVDFTKADFTTLGVLTFTTGTIVGGAGFVVGDTLTQAVTSATGFVHKVNITSGTFAGGDAAGTVIIKKTSAANFDNSNQLSNAAGDTATATAAVNTGNFDARFPKMFYLAENVYTPSSGAKVELLLSQLHAIYDDTQDDFGFVLDTSDEMSIPVRAQAGRRAEQAEGAFQIVGVWDNSALKLRIFIIFQGLAGVGDGTRTTVPGAVLSIDDANDECGDYQPLDFDALTIRLAFDTDDSGSGSNGKTAPDAIGGSGVVVEPI